METAIYLVLILTSVVSVTFIIERGLALRLARVLPPVLEEAVDNCQSPSDLPMLRRLCEQHPSPLGRLLLVAASHLDCPKGENIDALQTKARHEVLMGHLRLRQAAGTLTPEDLEPINRLLAP